MGVYNRAEIHFGEHNMLTTPFFGTDNKKVAIGVKDVGRVVTNEEATAIAKALHEEYGDDVISQYDGLIVFTDEEAIDAMIDYLNVLKTSLKENGE